MALAWKAGWVNALRGSNPLSSAVIREGNDTVLVPQFAFGGQMPVPIPQFWPYTGGQMASIEERKRSESTPARWRVIWREGKDKHFETFPTREKAEEFRLHVEASGNHTPHGWTSGYGWIGTFIPPALPVIEGEQSVATSLFVAAAAARRVRANEGTRRTYGEMTRRYILGTTFGATPWQEVTAETVSDWVLELRGRGLSPKTIRNVHSVASSAWKEAVQAGTAPRNPCVGLGPSEKTYPEDVATFLNPSQREAVIQACPTHYRLLLLFLLASGLRWSEATALWVSDFNAKAGTIRVRRAWKDTGGAATGVYVLGPPKTERGRRTVPLDPDTAALLKKSLKGRAGDVFLFTKPDGDIIRWRPFYGAVWRNQICRDLDTVLFPRRPKPHDLRHTHVSILVAGGASLLEVSRRLGHESVATTGDRYSHLFDESESRLALMMTGTLPKL